MIDPAEIRSIGHYQVVRFIARGGFAWVFEVRDPTLGCHRALKMLQSSDSGQDAERFRREATQLARLNDPCIVQVFDVGEDEATGCPYFTMTLVEGPSLAERLREQRERGGGLPLREVRSIFECVLSGLAHLHERAIVHRDVKPANILLTPDSRALLSDLGIARYEASDITRTGVAIGTAPYMSPEQALGRTVGPASDVFSVGLCLYHALEGRMVYETIEDVDAGSGDAVRAYAGSLIHRHADLAFAFSEATPAPVRSIVERACRTEPGQRYPDARAMLQDFREAFDQAEAQMNAEEISWWRVAATILGLIAVVAGAWWTWHPGADRAPVAVALPPPAPSVAQAERELEPAEAPVLVSLDSTRGPAPTFAPNDALQISFRVARDAFVHCFYRDARNQVFRIFPNPWQTEAHVAAGLRVQVPADGAQFHMKLEVPDSREEVVCLSTARDPGATLPPELKTADLTPLPVRSVEEVIAAFERMAPRGLGIARMTVSVAAN